MNSKVFKEIIQLNKGFYDSIGEDFNRTRQNFWDGWNRMLLQLEKRKPGIRNEKLKILDIGCGNGRLVKFLSENNFINFDYLGVDTNKILLKHASEHYDAIHTEFKELDAILNLNEINAKFDLIFAFGIAHHIPSNDFRKKWFSKVLSMLNPGGIFIFTTWNYDRDIRFGNAVKSIPGMFNESDLESGDYFVGWDKKPGIYRYVHLYDQEETAELLNGFDYNLEFSADGKTKNLNDYYFVYYN